MWLRDFRSLDLLPLIAPLTTHVHGSNQLAFKTLIQERKDVKKSRTNNNKTNKKAFLKFYKKVNQSVVQLLNSKFRQHFI